jgi:ubiquinone/menaquinone biosynthesis C-methylase UbiE
MLRTVLNRFPSLKRQLKRMRELIAPVSSVSAQYVEMDPTKSDGEAARLRDSWKSAALPQRQRELVDRQLAEFRRGASIDVFDVMVRALRGLGDINPGSTILEIGCSSGFYSEVFSIAGLHLQYTGCDYSEAFVALAHERYPNLVFNVEDATALHYADNSFDIVISGCCLLHIPEYGKAIAETARVAKRYAVFHRTPVVLGQPTKYFRKLAYGVPTVEIHFNETEFLALLKQHGLKLLATYTLHEEHDKNDFKCGSANRTYVCRKVTQ